MTKSAILALADRITALHGVNRQHLGDKAADKKLFTGLGYNGEVMGRVREYFAEMGADETPVTEKCKMLMDARDAQLMGNLDKMQELCAIRVETVNNYILGNSNFLKFFEMVSMADNERPVIQNETKQEIRIGYISDDGTPERTKVIKPQAETAIDLRYLVSDEVDYRITDIYNGNIAKTAQATFDIAYDLSMQTDKEAFTLFIASVANGGALGAFDLTNANKANNVFVPHSRIKAGNLPPTNVLEAPGLSGASLFNFGCLDTVQRYANRWGQAFSDGPLVPSGEIIINSADAHEIAKGIVPSGSTSNKVADQLLEQGWAKVHYLGRDWMFTADATLDPDVHVAYPVFNKPVGKVFLKPGLDMDVVEQKPRQNKEVRYQQKVFGIYIPSPWRVRAASIKYRN